MKPAERPLKGDNPYQHQSTNIPHDLENELLMDFVAWLCYALGLTGWEWQKSHAFLGSVITGPWEMRMSVVRSLAAVPWLLDLRLVSHCKMKHSAATGMRESPISIQEHSDMGHKWHPNYSNSTAVRTCGCVSHYGAQKSALAQQKWQSGVYSTHSP